jgi:hypothetical protein
MRLFCFYCGKSVTNEIQDDTIFRAIATCPKCIDNTRPLESSARSEGEAKGYVKALDDMESKLAEGNLVSGYVLSMIEGMKREFIDQLKSAHGGQDGKQS